MADNYLITGYHGEPHVTAENDRGINAGTFGAGRFVLPVGEQFRAEYIGNNTIRLYDGKLMDNGAAAGIPAGEFIDLLIANAGHGMNRNDLIVFQYSKDDSTGVESGSFVVIQGTETSGTAEDPSLAQEDLLTNTATFDQMALHRVSVSGATIAAPAQVFNTFNGHGNDESTEYPGCYYRMVDGEEEWENPPMVCDVVYRTTERVDGKPVYRGRHFFATLPNTNSVSHYIVKYGGAKIDKVLSANGVVCRSNTIYADLPYCSATNGVVSAQCYANASAAGGLSLHIITFADMSTFCGWVDCKFTLAT